jgi:hypothetical protein
LLFVLCCETNCELIPKCVVRSIIDRGNWFENIKYAPLTVVRTLTAPHFLPLSQSYRRSLKLTLFYFCYLNNAFKSSPHFLSHFCGFCYGLRML